MTADSSKISATTIYDNDQNPFYHKSLKSEEKTILNSQLFTNNTANNNDLCIDDTSSESTLCAANNGGSLASTSSNS
jgi:hypothetical protein